MRSLAEENVFLKLKKYNTDDEWCFPLSMEKKTVDTQEAAVFVWAAVKLIALPSTLERADKPF